MNNDIVHATISEWKLQSQILVLPDIFGVRVTANEDDVRAAWTDIIAGRLADVVGGSSITIGKGFWYDENRRLFAEPSVLVEANCDNPLSVFAAVAPTLCTWLQEARQEAAWLRFNDIVVLATPVDIGKMHNHLHANGKGE